MKVRNIKITIEPLRDVLTRFAIAYGKVKRGETVTPEQGISFETMDALRRTLTRKRMELLHAIKVNEPDSIYALAKIVDRDLKSVNTDIKALHDLGLVSLKHSNDERNRVRPRVEFDRIDVQIAV
jgi:predicted transcriptional regulator